MLARLADFCVSRRRKRPPPGGEEGGGRGHARDVPVLPLPHFGNLLSVTLIRLLFGVRYTDLGPFRAIRAEALSRLAMEDTDYGWTVEMQVKAAAAGLRIVEVPVRYRRRIGVSKISGTLRGSFLAGRKILGTIARHRGWRIPGPGAAAAPGPALVSVIVPVLDEAAEIGGCLRSLLANAPPLEVLVVDGGSGDGTREIAGSFPGVRVLEARRGRARQMNEGARRARGEILWFLHADGRPGPGAAGRIRRALARPGAAGGAFRFALRTEAPWARIVETVVRLRGEWLREAYGDQGIFLTRRAFQAVGGFPEVPLLEDLRLVRALHRAGGFRILEEPLPTSARAWEEGGVLSTIARYQAIALPERLGAAPEMLAGWRP